MRLLPKEIETLWTLFTAPVVWALHFLVCYVGAAIYCAKQDAVDFGFGVVRAGIGAVTIAALAMIVLSAVLAGIHHGLSQRLDPGPAVSGNAYERSSPRIPTHWAAANDALRNSAVLRSYFGDQFVDCFCTLKEVEADRFNAEPTSRDFEWYLRTV